MEGNMSVLKSDQGNQTQELIRHAKPSEGYDFLTQTPLNAKNLALCGRAPPTDQLANGYVSRTNR